MHTVSALQGEQNILNDNFCDDLINGSDESGSAACAGLSEKPTYFYCRSTTLSKQRVFSSRVDDGVCDCCDGSDEPRSGAVCEDQCAALEAAEKFRQDARNEVRRNGVRRRAAAIEAAQAELADLKQAVSREAELLPGLDKTIAEAEAALEDAKILASARLADRVHQARALYHRAVSQQFSASERATLQRLVSALVLRGNEEVGEVSLKAAAEHYVHAGDDPDDAQVLLLSMETADTTDLSAGLYVQMENGHMVLHEKFSSGGASAHKRYNLAHLRDTVRLEQDSMELMSEALGLARLDVEGLLHVLSAAMMESQHLHILGLCLLDAGYVSIQFSSSHRTEAEEQAHHLAIHEAAVLTTSVPKTPKVIKETGIESDATQEQHQRTADNARKEKEALKARSAMSATALKFDYGPHEFLFPLTGQCASVFDKAYRYNACPFKQAHQDNTLLGQYDKHETRVNAKSGEEELWMLFKSGAYCHATRRPREMHVRLECADADKPTLSSVSEYEVCVYNAVLHTHVACLPDRDEF